MKHDIMEFVPGILNGLAAITVILVSFLIDYHFPIAKDIAKPLGEFMVFAGMCLVIWAAFQIKQAIMGEVKPKLGVLVQTGPYRYVRHPVYLGMTIALFGLTIVLRSWLGMLAVFILFLPSEIYRARLEDKALAQRFSKAWAQYALKTGFMLPVRK